MATVWLLSGCAVARHPQVALGPKYKPSNVHQLASFIPPPIRRVAVLPISAATEDWQAEISRVELQAVLQAELGKTKRFEIVSVSPAQIQSWTGRATWSVDEVLPADFFQRLQETYDCQAVLFPRLSSYHPYKPLVIGWNVRLVEITGRYVVWAVDEVFDANEPSVANAAQYYDLTHTPEEKIDAERSTILLSPRQFAQYSLHAVFETLPRR